MKSRFPLIDISRTELVLDASVFINLLATGVAKVILGSLPNPVFIEARAFAEIRRHPIPNADLSAEIAELLESGLLEKRTMSPEALDLFMELTGGDLTGGLDDGEAATITYALSISGNTLVAIDERKATRVFSERWPRRTLVDTVTLLAQPNCRSHLGPETLANACFSALVHARMRVRHEAMAWVLNTVGRERARQCPSLGNAALLAMDLQPKA
jgi:hypothetical protein